MTIHIHQLKELIEDNEDIYGYCYNTSSIPYEETPVVSYTFRAGQSRLKSGCLTPWAKTCSKKSATARTR